MAANSSGYDSRFKDTPPGELTCLICHCVARDPQQIQCCAQLYCKTCLDREKHRTNQCPTCRQPIGSFSDKLSHRRIKALKDSCDNEDNGCTWSGELSSLEAHSTECRFSPVTCPNNCSARLVRRQVKRHLKIHCLHRDYKCRLCGQEGKYGNITTTHLEQCPNITIRCPNTGCTTMMKRFKVSQHRRSCRKELVKCSYAKVGCKKMVVRDKCKKHEADNVELHLKLAVDTLESKVRVVPVVLKLSDFNKCKDANDVWYSGGFYSHPAGYRTTISVDTNGNREENRSHLSMYVCLTGGVYDDNLVWPFNGTITLELLNQLEDRNHKVMTLQLCGSGNSTRCAVRPPDGGRNSQGYGWSKFIPHTGLAYTSSNNCQYLKDDCLYFRVTKVDLNPTNTIKPWLAL